MLQVCGAIHDSRRPVSDLFCSLAILAKLEVAKGDYISVWKSDCISDTRVGIQYRIASHLSRRSNRFVWIRGSPGMGKTAIAKSVAADLDKQKRLAASFFFDKSGANPYTNSSKRFLSTLARQLANFHPVYRSLLFRILDSDHHASLLSGKPQLKRLIIDPLNLAIEDADSADPCVIVLDGLDECGDYRALEALMDIILELASLPKNFQILVSSRPESEISDAWGRSGLRVPTENVNGIGREEINEDITAYLQLSLSKIPSRGSKQWPPPEEQISRLAASCSGIFEIAAIRLRILEESRGMPMEEALRDLMEDTRRGITTFTTEYLRILRKAYLTREDLTDDPDEAEERNKVRVKVIQRFRTVVGALLVLRVPLSFRSLALLIEMNENEVSSVLRPISSIIDVPSDASQPIRFFHATCQELLLGMPRGTEQDRIFFFSDQRGLFLGAYCLKLMIEKLRPDRLVNLDVRSYGHLVRIEPAEDLLYAMTWWSAHLSLHAPEQQSTALLRTFISRHLVAWVELMLCLQLDMLISVKRTYFQQSQFIHTRFLECLTELSDCLAVCLIIFV